MHFQACAYCDHPNPVGTNFCNHCGAALHLKPCRRCGAVAVARASHCPACRFEFPHRPTISVDIPWAIAGAASSTPAAPGGLPHAAGPEGTDSRSEASRLAASAQALAETQRLIEKASSRLLPAEPRPELALFTGGRDERASPRDDAVGRGEDWNRPTPGLRHRQAPLDNVLLAEEAVTSEDFERDAAARPAATARYAPMVFLSLLGLVAAIALVYLVQYAGEGASGTIREIASPHKLLLPPATLPAEAAAPSEAPLATQLEVPKDEAVAATAAAAPLPGAPASPAVAPQPAAASQPSLAPVPGSEACRSELKALNLCGKVNQRL